ncbi:MAG TPA: helix-turn-helix domain-containing protein [Caulobacter sp.]|nr:helix-turn-helix domain-containing protein [Caulobacter sp.]
MTAESVEKGSRRERTRRALVAAAAELTAQKGFDRASLDEICARAGMTRGAFHGNFKSRDELFLAVMESQGAPVEADFRPGAPLRVQMRILGQAVAAAARARLPRAAEAAAVQLHVLTRPALREEIAARTAENWRRMAEGFVRILPPGSLPMPAERFVKVIEALVTGLMFTYFQNPERVTEEDIVAAFEALAGPPAAAWPGGASLTPQRRW